MDKNAQQSDSELFITTPIDNDKVLVSVWDKYFSDKHKEIVDKLRASFQQDQELHAVLSAAFQAFTWPEFAGTPTRNSFKGVKQVVDKLAGIPRAMAAPGVSDAIKLFNAQYDSMLQHLQSSAAKPKAEHPKPKATPALAGKIKQLQSLLGVKATGVWDKLSNDTFLKWLNEKGWSKYIKGNRFTGKIDDAISALLIEKASPEGQPSVEFAERQASRLDALKKLGLK